MNLQRIFLISGLVLSIYILPAFVNNVFAGGGTNICTADLCQSSQGDCEDNTFCSQNERREGPRCAWCGDPNGPCVASMSDCPTPGNCTVSVDSGSIDDSLVCICQAQTKKGKDTFKVVECNDEKAEVDCERRQGEVKRYIDADPNSSQGLILDCTEINCNDFCFQ